MNNKLMKYEKNFWDKVVYKIKLFFRNKKQEIQEVQEIHMFDDELKKNFVKLVIKFDKGEIEEKDLSLAEKKMLIKYYEDKNNELDKKIENKKMILLNLNRKLDNYCKKKDTKKCEN